MKVLEIAANECRDPADVGSNKSFVSLALAVAVCLLASASLCVAQPTLTPLYSFTGPPDGANPRGGLVMDGAGNLYGTTTYGGTGVACGFTTGCGIVFRLAPDGTETVLYSFCSQPGCADGGVPQVGLIIDAAGNLYGTTSGGGDANRGTVFSVAPDGTETVLYSFCSQPGCADGTEPVAGLIMGPRGNLYGTTLRGGTESACFVANTLGCGTVFKLFHNAARTKWREKVLYSFCAQPGCADGFEPQGRLILAAGRLWGTTAYGGTGGCHTSAGCGTVFTLARDGTGTVEAVLYSFCSQPGCADGGGPTGGLVMDAAGNLYGTTAFGGTGECSPSLGCGTVFRLAPDGSETVLYNFQPTLSGYPGPSNVVADAAGNLYGTISRHPPTDRCRFSCPPPSPGEAYEIQSDGAFRSLGTLPPWPSDLVLDDLGNLYGETVVGGTGPCGSGEGCGTVFELTP